MKRLVKFQAKSMDAVKKIIANSYKDYTIRKIDKVKIFDSMKKVIYIHLCYKSDSISSLMVCYNPNINEIEITKDNGNKIRKYRELFSL